jgi:chloride channel protein, CIC family
METSPILAYPDDTCREVAERLAGSSQKRVPVVSRDDPTKLLGIISLSDLLKARERACHDEDKRERFFGLPEQSKIQDEVNLAAP